MASPPRLWFVNRFFHPDRSATSQLVSDLAFHLAARGWKVSALTSRGLYDGPGELPEGETIADVEIHRVVRARFGRHALAGRAIDYALFYAGFARALTRLAAPGDIVLAKTDPPLLSAALAPAARRAGLTLVNWLQDLYPEVALGLGMRSLAPFAPALRAARDASLRAARFNVTISPGMQARLAARGLDPQRVRVIENWCDDDAVRPLARADNPLARDWGLGQRFVLGYSGNLGRAHDYATLVGAADLTRGEDMLFLVIGGGAGIAPMRAEIARRGLSDRFRFLPYQDAAALPQSLTAPDAHWLSLRPAMEGLILPSKIYGVAAAGRPMLAVADPQGEIATLIEGADCGAAVAPGDVAGLAARLVALARDRQLRARQGANARALVETRFSRANALAKWEALLEEAG